ncbi:MAG: glycosyltransferase family 2 protein [Methyloprofundus sp.]|nr:glycosyltransferase family 2 protein [Methyloprofundus sp.]
MVKISVAIPCYKVKEQILSVIERIPAQVERIYVVDDCCPEQSGLLVQAQCHDPRVSVIFHASNQGVGGAVISAYRQALDEQMDIVVKIDGDGQMDPELLPQFIEPIVLGFADYTKGNRFFNLETLIAMPTLRKVGNAALSFVNKFSSGYWNIMDPTNGYTAIHCRALALLPLDKLSKRYFFESDMLFRLGTLRAVVSDISMAAIYADEKSNLQIKQVMLEFPWLYLKAFFKRVFYNYFLRDFNGASLELVLGLLLILFGAVWGAEHWFFSIVSQQVASSGTVMLAVLPIIIGFQLLLSAIQFDMANIPREPLLKKLRTIKK